MPGQLRRYRDASAGKLNFGGGARGAVSCRRRRPFPLAPRAAIGSPGTHNALLLAEELDDGHHLDRDREDGHHRGLVAVQTAEMAKG